MKQTAIGYELTPEEWKKMIIPNRETIQRRDAFLARVNKEVKTYRDEHGNMCFEISSINEQEILKLLEKDTI